MLRLRRELGDESNWQLLAEELPEERRKEVDRPEQVHGTLHDVLPIAAETGCQHLGSVFRYGGVGAILQFLILNFSLPRNATETISQVNCGLSFSVRARQSLFEFLDDISIL